jgi:glucose/arabinose dehydrogenase
MPHLKVLLFLAAAVLAAGTAIGLGNVSAQGTQLGLRTVASGLDRPLFVTAPAGERGRLYIVEQSGRVRVFENGKLRNTPFLDLSAKTQADGERGLLGLAFAPDYAKSRQFVVDYTDLQGNTRVVRYRSNGTSAIPGSAQQLLFVRQPYPNHNGGMVVYGPDGMLYVGMGDGGDHDDPQNRAQNPKTLLGKILLLDARKPGAAAKIVALGVRNPWRFSFDRSTNDLYIGDVGQNEVEEVDWVKWPLRGLLNFGWNVYEGSHTFSENKLGPGTLVAPVAEYTHDNGCSMTGGYVYRGKAVPSAVGRYFYGDYCKGTVWSLKMAGGKAQDVRVEPITVANLVSFGQDASGELYLVSGDGIVYRLTG